MSRLCLEKLRVTRRLSNCHAISQGSGINSPIPACCLQHSIQMTFNIPKYVCSSRSTNVFVVLYRTRLRIDCHSGGWHHSIKSIVWPNHSSSCRQQIAGNLHSVSSHVDSEHSNRFFRSLVTTVRCLGPHPWVCCATLRMKHG